MSPLSWPGAIMCSSRQLSRTRVEGSKGEKVEENHRPPVWLQLLLHICHKLSRCGDGKEEDDKLSLTTGLIYKDDNRNGNISKSFDFESMVDHVHQFWADGFLRDDEENSPEENEDTNDCIAQENVSL